MSTISSIYILHKSFAQLWKCLLIVLFNYVRGKLMLLPVIVYARTIKWKKLRENRSKSDLYMRNGFFFHQISRVHANSVFTRTCESRNY